MADVAQRQLDAPARQLEALEEAFAMFGQQTAALRQAYSNLKQEAERINMKLEEANSQLQQKVRELDEAYNFQRSILDSIPISAVVTDLQGRISAFNPAAEQMCALPRKDALGRPAREVMGPHAELLEGVLDGRFRQESLRREVGENDTRVISSTACLVEDSAGRPIGAIQLDRDITRLCNLEQELMQQQKLADLGKMAAGLAHEVRKPLNGIKGFASLLQRNAGEGADGEKYTSHIIEAADRLNGMLGRLLDFARPAALQTAPCDLRREAEHIVEFVRAEDIPCPAQLRVEIEQNAQMVLADRDKLQQVLLNLIKNGVEALGEEGGEVLVRARRLAPQDDEPPRVRVSVEDTGCGIPPEKLPHVLEPFFTGKEGGTGLGLAVVDRLLQLHGSRLEIASEPGEGTTMEFLLAASDPTEES